MGAIICMHCVIRYSLNVSLNVVFVKQYCALCCGSLSDYVNHK